MKLYLAGKIGPNDWRHSIVLGLRDAIQNVRYDDHGHGQVLMALPDEWPILRGALLGQHDYVGPFFMPASPGNDSVLCVHGDNQHGSAIDTNADDMSGSYGPDSYSAIQAGKWHNVDHKETRQQVIRLCLKAITKADAIFAWMDSCTAYGTLFELGFALAHRKPIWWGEPDRPYDQIASDFWFARTSAEVTETAPDARTALERMLARKFRPQINGYVYILRSGDFIKIGKSKDVDQRITQISPKTPMPVTLLHTIACDDMSWAESSLHRHYAHYRTNGEWFLLPKADLDWLLTIKHLSRSLVPERLR